MLLPLQLISIKAKHMTELTSTDPVNSINKINTFFVNIGKDDLDNIPASPLTHNMDLSPKSNPKSLFNTDCVEVESIILNLKSDCPGGRDNIYGINPEKNIRIY